ncbi:MAG: hypothetical protein KF810_12385 [Rhizobiaceae bacterium]|nr:hypothetical protein [Rhizobiaceae bacterium]
MERTLSKLAWVAIFSLLTSAILAQADSGKLLKDRQTVNLDFKVGPASKVQGSRGMGKFRQGLDEATESFGPAKVIKHTANKLRFRGKHDDCTLKVDRTVTCKSGSKGTWR